MQAMPSEGGHQWKSTFAAMSVCLGKPSEGNSSRIGNASKVCTVKGHEHSTLNTETVLLKQRFFFDVSL